MVCEAVRRYLRWNRLRGRWGHGGGMEGVWRCSDVGRATSWYCSTYKGEYATPKCIFLTTCLRWFFAQIRRRPLKVSHCRWDWGHPIQRSREPTAGRLSERLALAYGNPYPSRTKLM